MFFKQVSDILSVDFQNKHHRGGQQCLAKGLCSLPFNFNVHRRLKVHWCQELTIHIYKRHRLIFRDVNVCYAGLSREVFI